MKRNLHTKVILKIASAGLLLLVGLMPVGCNDHPKEEDNTPPPTPAIHFAENGQSRYVVVSAMGAEGYDMADQFRGYFAAATGITLEYKADVLLPAAGDACEIVIGSTDRDGLFDADVEGIVTDGYLLKVAGSRLLIYADDEEGYEKAFAAFFREAMGIEDITQLQAPADSAVSLPRDFVLRGEPTYRIEQNKTRSGYSYRVEGGEIREDNRCTFKETLTYHFDTPIATTFNVYTLHYTCSAYLRGEITYIQSGVTHTEEFFLEPGEKATFRSFCDGAVKGKNGRTVSALTLTPLQKQTVRFTLSDFTVSSESLPGEDVVYISDGKYRLGVKLSWGGGVSYLEDLQDGDDSLTNLLNNHDTGRLIQQSYYGAQSAPYETAVYSGNVWAYNPVQGGDQYGNTSKLVDYTVSADGREIWVKCQPLDWAHKNSRTPSYMENTYSLKEGHVRVDNRFIDFSGYPHNLRQQEVPAFYTVSYFSDFVFYFGDSPWTGDTLTVKKDLPFWAGNSPDPYFRLRNDENWCAWVTSTGYALGLYSPLANVLVAGRYLYNGSKSPANAATSYVAPLLTHQLEFCKPYTYSYYITTGTVEEVRGRFETIRRGK